VAFIDANKDDVVEGRRLGVEPICAVLQVASSTYYAARDRAPSARAQRDAELTPRLVELWKANYEVYGSRKLWKAARRAGIDVGRDQTRRLMAEAGIQGALRSKRVRTTRWDRSAADTPISSSASSALMSRTSYGSRTSRSWRRGRAWPTSASSSMRSHG
jgi:putative transposase